MYAPVFFQKRNYLARSNKKRPTSSAQFHCPALCRHIKTRALSCPKALRDDVVLDQFLKL